MTSSHEEEKDTSSGMLFGLVLGLVLVGLVLGLGVPALALMVLVLGMVLDEMKIFRFIGAYLHYRKRTRSNK